MTALHEWRPLPAHHPQMINLRILNPHRPELSIVECRRCKQVKHRIADQELPEDDVVLSCDDFIVSRIMTL